MGVATKDWKRLVKRRFMWTKQQPPCGLIEEDFKSKLIELKYSQESPLKKETVKLLADLNRAITSHISLATLLGGSSDNILLREELRKSRRTAQETAVNCKQILMAKMVDPHWTDRYDRCELERIWTLLLCSLDFLESTMHRSLKLLLQFSISNQPALINTGIVTNNKNLEDIDQSGDMLEVNQLWKELIELRSQLSELKTTIEIKPLEEDYLNGLQQTTLNSASSTDGAESSASDEVEGITPAQRRCICYILTVMISLFSFIMLFGVILAVFS